MWRGEGGEGRGEKKEGGKGGEKKKERGERVSSRFGYFSMLTKKEKNLYFPKKEGTSEESSVSFFEKEEHSGGEGVQEGERGEREKRAVCSIESKRRVPTLFSFSFFVSILK